MCLVIHKLFKSFRNESHCMRNIDDIKFHTLKILKINISGKEKITKKLLVIKRKIINLLYN